MPVIRMIEPVTNDLEPRKPDQPWRSFLPRLLASTTGGVLARVISWWLGIDH